MKKLIIKNEVLESINQHKLDFDKFMLNEMLDGLTTYIKETFTSEEWQAMSITDLKEYGIENFDHHNNNDYDNVISLNCELLEKFQNSLEDSDIINLEYLESINLNTFKSDVFDIIVFNLDEWFEIVETIKPSQLEVGVLMNINNFDISLSDSDDTIELTINTNGMNITDIIEVMENTLSYHKCELVKGSDCHVQQHRTLYFEVVKVEE